MVRDLHDGAQQRLVHTIITLQLANQALEPDPVGASELMGEALAHAQHANVELRELAHGILPSVLTQGGLRAAVEALASRTPVPVEVSVSVDRLPAPVEATAYFVAAEALTNLAKHANATGATVRAHIEDGTSSSGARRRRRRRAVRGQQPRRAGGPAGGPRRPAPDRQPSRRRHTRRRRHPACRPAPARRSLISSRSGSSGCSGRSWAARTRSWSPRGCRCSSSRTPFRACRACRPRRPRRSRP